MTIEQICDLAENACRYRYAPEAAQRRRPPPFKDIVEFLKAEYGNTLSVWAEPWTETASRKSGRIIVWRGKPRTGFRLRIFEKNKFTKALVDHRTTDPYRTNWDLIQWIAKNHAVYAARPAPVSKPPAPRP